MRRSHHWWLSAWFVGLLAQPVAAQSPADKAVIVVNAASPATNAAFIRIDGEPAGQVPARIEVTPGRHLVQVGKRGFATFSQWTEAEAGQVVTIPVMLQAEGPKTGSLLVNADIIGASVFVDGQQRGGTPVIIDGLSGGDHVVEIKPQQPGYKAFSQVVNIVPGQQTKIDAVLRVSEGVGSLRVITNAPGSIVSIDGIDVGAAPAAKGDLAPGQHIVSARAIGYEPMSQTVEVVSGRERVVSLRLLPRQVDVGRIAVHADVPEAQVWIDGVNMGTPPVFVDEPGPGVHSIVVKAEGYREVRRTCRVTDGESCQIDIRMNEIGVPVRVESNVPTAQLFVDGIVKGNVPWEGDLAVGVHRIEVRADGHTSYDEEIELHDSSQMRLIQATLARAGVRERSKTYQEREEEARAAVSHSAAALPENVTTLDLSLGWVHLFELRLTTAVLEFLDVGVAVRTFGRLTEFELNSKAGWHPIKAFSLGGLLRVGGGIGPARQAAGSRHPANDFFIALDAIASLHLSGAGAFSLWFGMDFSSDRWDFLGSDKNTLSALAGSRQNLVRGRLGGALDLVLSRRWNLWFVVEGIIAGKERRIYGDIFGVNKNDTKFYARGGVTYKFGRIGAQ